MEIFCHKKAVVGHFDVQPRPQWRTNQGLDSVTHGEVPPLLDQADASQQTLQN
jgi:hypothetical protein